MSRARAIITSFNAGEMSPLIGGRPDLEKFRAGLGRCENFLPRIQGAVTRRGGTRFVAATRDRQYRSWLVPFEYAVNDAFVLELGDHYVRFYRNRAVLELDDEIQAAPAWSSATAYEPGDFVTYSGVVYQAFKESTNVQPDAPDDNQWRALTATGPGGNLIYEIWSPYAVEDSDPTKKMLSDKDGTLDLRYVQSGDVINFAGAGERPWKLTRYGNLHWRFEEFVTVGGPFKDPNQDKAVTVQAGATGDTVYETQDAVNKAITGGTITLTASADIFLEGHVGAKFQLEMQDGSQIKPWYVYKETVNGDVVSSDGKYYLCTDVGPGVFSDSAVTGTEKPIHTEGAYWDGDGKDGPSDDDRGPIGVEWKYLHAGYGWAQIISVTDARNAAARVLSTIPIEVMDDPTWRWAMGAWSDAEGWPTCVAYFRERLTFSKNRTLYFSQAGDFANFKARDFGEVLASSAVVADIDGGQGDPITWLASAERLLAGTGNTVHAVGEAATSATFGPTNYVTKDQVVPGANGVQPLMADSVLYVEKGSTIVNELVPGDQKYEAADLTIFSEHLTRKGLIQAAWHKLPYSIAWCVTSEGSLLALTYRKQQGVAGWARMVMDGTVEAACVIPAPDGSREDLWLQVQRTIDGTDYRYVEYLTPEWSDGDSTDLFSYSDCNLAYSGASTGAISGLDHLEGKTVNVLAGGAVHPQCVVSGGQITLNRTVTRAVVGLPAPAYLKLMPLEAGGVLGSAQGAVKRVAKVILRLIDSLGGRCGPNEDVMDALTLRDNYDDMDKAPPLFTGDCEASFPGDWSGRATVAISCDQDFPFTLAAMMLDVTTNEG